MVTTTTKTLNYSIIRGNHTNSVNATITSTPGFNVNYFGKIPGILKLVELIITVVALGLVASRRREGAATAVGWPIEFYMVGEVFFLCVCTASLVYLFGQLTTFCWSVTSSVLIPKTTYLEVILNLFFVLMWITAGIELLCLTAREGWNYPMAMLYSDWGCRIAAGSLGLFLAVFFIASLALAIKEFAGPRNQA
ncbi:uncharacterized protein LOC129584853 isoform X3 [Paramacrobiotus metropolitanus]|uniref:uncharacterized protein LOC129584853 isoform X3 n=1 Tax=Paramacrobiotus metropolitanus TaxID=2943436 RepID=UPI0024456EAA|nr:uncharacterized protein LOC129584853 isoform X3 [Paramacrobiotus metropolitanus]